MQVRLLGFRLFTQAANLDLQSYVKFVKQKHGEARELGAHNRLLFIDSTHSPKYYVGLLVTVKDQKTFCELVEKSGRLTVKVSELDDDSKLMDFNFFVVNKENGLGLYQHYHQSCSLNTFGSYNSKRFVEYRDSVVKEKLEKLAEDQRSDKKAENIKKKYKGRLQWEILVRKEKLKELMAELDRIKSFEYSFLSLTADEPEFKPISDYVRRENRRLAFTSGSPVSKIADAVAKFVSSTDIDSGKVTGVDADGIDRVLRIADNPDNFGEYPYDEIAPKINSLDTAKFQDSWVIKELLLKCSDHKHIFEAKLK